MNKYLVQVSEVHVYTVEVEAANTEDAKALVTEQIEQGELNFDSLDYSHTLPKEEWHVTELSQ